MMIASLNSRITILSYTLIEFNVQIKHEKYVQNFDVLGIFFSSEDGNFHSESQLCFLVFVFSNKHGKM